MKYNKVVITGGSSGIGLELAHLLQANGCQVVVLSRSVGQLAEGVLHIPTDLRDLGSIEAAFDQLGSIDALVNNAGIAYKSSMIDGDLREWDEMWEVNVRALGYCSQLALRAFPDSGGQIVNVSSMSGHRVPPSGGFYSPTKFAVRAMSEALRLELRARGSMTRISSVSPGFVDTPLLDTYFKGREEQLQQTKETIQMLQPEDIARQILHILETPLAVEIGDIGLRSVGQSV